MLFSSYILGSLGQDQTSQQTNEPKPTDKKIKSRFKNINIVVNCIRCDMTGGLSLFSSACRFALLLKTG